MASEPTPDDAIRRVVAALDAAGVPYMLTGSFASSLHGAPRSTQDVDFVIAPTTESLERLLASFPEDRYYVSRESATTALRRSGMFNVIDRESGWKIDFIVRKARAFSLAEFDRRTPITVLGAQIQVATAEDVLLAKLEWAKRSGSGRQIEDAAGIIRTQGERLDTTYVASWADRLELDAEWTAARKMAAEL